MSILNMSLSIATPTESLSSAKALLGGSTLTAKLSQLSLTTPSSIRFKTMTIRMGGGPRTYPGGVSKWQWKRMQAKKAKQLLKARLARERQIYEMRKRAELKAAVSELERPWEAVEKPPNLFSVGADEQLKVLADRFQKPGGFDLWCERDGPELFRPDNGLPSARFFPKGVVHSSRPYGKIDKMTTASDELDSSCLEEDKGPGANTESAGRMGLQREGSYKNLKSSLIGSEGVAKDLENKNVKGNFRKKQSRRTYLSDSDGMNSNETHLHGRNHSKNNRIGSNAGEFRRSKSYEKGQNMNSEVFDMSLQNDGSFGFELEN